MYCMYFCCFILDCLFVEVGKKALMVTMPTMGVSFNSSGTGQQFGPVFTTGDVIGCGFNLVDRSIFFTRNGMNLGTHNYVHVEVKKL